MFNFIRDSLLEQEIAGLYLNLGKYSYNFCHHERPGNHRFSHIRILLLLLEIFSTKSMNNLKTVVFTGVKALLVLFQKE